MSRKCKWQLNTSDHVVERLPQSVVQPGGERHHAIADLTAGQGVGHARLDRLLAARTPVAMDHMLGHHRLDVLGNVFRVASARLPAARQPALAMRTAGSAVLLVFVNLFRRRPTSPLVSRLSPRFFPAFRRVRLLMQGLHPRGRRRRTDRRTLALRPPQLGSQLQQRKDDGLFALRINRPSFLGRQVRPQREIENAACRHGIGRLQSCVCPMS